MLGQVLVGWLQRPLWGEAKAGAALRWTWLAPVALPQGTEEPCSCGWCLKGNGFKKGQNVAQANTGGRKKKKKKVKKRHCRHCQRRSRGWRHQSRDYSAGLFCSLWRPPQWSSLNPCSPWRGHPCCSWWQIPSNIPSRTWGLVRDPMLEQV